jgi:hypothetical protein
MSRTEKLSALQVARCKRAWRDAIPIKDISAELNISKATLYRYAEVYDFGPHPNRDHKYQPRTAEPRPRPKVFRCAMCDGRSGNAAGHELCQQRLRAA